MLKKDGEIKNPIPLGSLYNLCKRMNISYSGAEYRKIKEAIGKLKRLLKELKLLLLSLKEPFTAKIKNNGLKIFLAFMIG